MSQRSCPECGKIFSHRNSLSVHMKKHSAKKNSRPPSPANIIVASKKIKIQSNGEKLLDEKIDDMAKQYEEDFSVAKLNSIVNVFCEFTDAWRDDVRSHCDELLGNYKNLVSAEHNAFDEVRDVIDDEDHKKWMNDIKGFNRGEGGKVVYKHTDEDLKAMSEELDAKMKFIQFVLKKRQVIWKERIVSGIKDFQFEDEKKNADSASQFF